MAIDGLITTREVLKHTAIIIREFGLSVYLRCCLAIALRHHTTFLNIIFPTQRHSAEGHRFR